jgi:tetratricopeptide (TPR) repeat protein
MRVRWVGRISISFLPSPFFADEWAISFARPDQAFHYHMESYRHYPANLDVISWLGVWYVKSELYEKAIHFFERAGQIQPNEVKWQLMVTSCYRRMGNYQKALELYERIHVTHPDNLECLRYLVALCADMGRPHEHYQQKLARLDRSSQHQVPAPVRQGSSKLAASDTGGASPSLAEGDESECGSPGFTAPNARTFQKSSIGSPNAGVRDEVEFGNVDIGSLLA